jgi:GntR family phosphonate transport system transcriptional regulator
MVSEGAALLRTVSVSVDPQGVPVEHGTTWFAGERVTLTLDEP